MKKQILLSTLILCMCAGGAYAQLIFTADFSSAQGYKDGPVVGQPTGAASKWLNGIEAIPADNIVVQNGAMVTTVTGADSKWVIMMLPVQKTTITVTWDWKYTGPADRFVDTGFCISDTGNFAISGDTEPTFNEQGAMVRMTNDTTNGTGVIDVRDGDWSGGGSYKVVTPVLYQDGKKISMRSEIDIKAWTFSVFAKREGEQEVQIADGYGFRRLPTAETDGLNCIAIWEDLASAEDVGGQCTIDNIVIAGPASLSDWALF